MRLPYGAVERAFFVRENVFVNVASRGIRKTRKCCSLCPPRRQQIRQHWHCCSLCCSFCPSGRQQIINFICRRFVRLSNHSHADCFSNLFRGQGRPHERFQGKPEVVNEMKEKLRQGPSMAVVNQVIFYRERVKEDETFFNPVYW